MAYILGSFIMTSDKVYGIKEDKSLVELDGLGVSFYLTITATATGGTADGIAVTASSDTGDVTATTDSTGKATLNVKQGSTYKVKGTKTGYSDTNEVSVTITELTTAVELTCNKYATATITVEDKEGAVSGRIITATNGTDTQTAITNSNGVATLTLKGQGSYTFTPDMPSGASGVESTTISVSYGGSYTGTVSIVRVVIYAVAEAVGTSDPEDRVTYPQTVTIGGKTYPNSAYGKTPASGSGANCMNDWAGVDLISGIKRQKGSISAGWTDVTDKKAAEAGSQGVDVVTYFPTWWFKRTNDGTTKLRIWSNTKLDGFEDYAGSVGSDRKGFFRLGNFLATNSGSKAYSYGGGSPTGNVSLTNWITYAKARGTGYDLMTWYQLDYVRSLFVLLYRSTDGQTALGRGYVDGSGVQANTAMTFDNDYGMKGSTSGTQRMAFFWIEDFWGNMWQWVGGASTNSNRQLCTQTGYSTASNSDMTSTGVGPSSSISGYISKSAGTTETGDFPTECSGSETTYLADVGYVASSDFPIVGGYYGNGGYAGPFYSDFYNDAGYTYSDVGARISVRV